VADIVEHARTELKKTGKSDAEVAAYVTVIQAYVDMGLPSESHQAAIQVISDLLGWKNISQITDDPSEWQLLPGSDLDGNPGISQNLRNPVLFSGDGGKTYYSLPELRIALNIATSTRLIRASAHKS
jgi:hypothetical protein